MTSFNFIPLALTVTILLGASATAQSQGLTREQVRAELTEAIRTGEIMGDSNQGLTAYQLAPHRFPPRPVTTGKTRDQVRAELAAAVRAGDLLADADQGRTAYELAPHRFPPRPLVASKTREEVREELALAVRLGDTPIRGDQGLTPAQKYPWRFAEVRAAHEMAVKAGGAGKVAQNIGTSSVQR